MQKDYTKKSGVCQETLALFLDRKNFSGNIISTIGSNIITSKASNITVAPAKTSLVYHPKVKKGVTHDTLQARKCEKRTRLRLLLIRKLTVGAIIDRPQTTAKHKKRATNGRPYKQISA